MKQNFLVLLLLFTSLLPTRAARTYAGGDISLLPLYEQIQSKYYDYDGNPIDDVVKFYAQEGMNLMRVRLMVNPSAYPGAYSYGSNAKWLGYDPNCCQTLEYILPICKRIKEAGMALLLDFHYTDYWADPYHQWTPEDWKNIPDDQLPAKLYEYTKESLIWLRDRGVVPDMIQTGNEISYGMLWGPAGTAEGDLKKATGENDRSCWERLTNMLKEAGRACREICPQAQIVIHTEQVANHWNLWNFYRWMGEFGVDYDIIGLSYYPYWHVDVDKAEEEITDLEKCFPDKKIWIVEFNWPYDWEADGENALYEKYPHTPDGQIKITQAVIDMLNRHDNANGLIWWWPEFNKKDYQKYDGETWDGWYSSPLFNSNDGRALPATRTLAAYAESETVYFTNVPASWSSVGVYAWTDGDNVNEGGWPGNAAELTDMTYKGKPVWKYTFTGHAHKYLILNNRHLDGNGNWVSTDQTLNLDFEDGGIYWLSDWRTSDNGQWKYEAWKQDTGTSLDAPCVYLTNIPSGWDNVSLSAWANRGGSDVNEVDGAALELTDLTYNGKTVYKYTFCGDSHDYLLFHNRPGGNWDSSAQAVVRPFVNGALYILSDEKNGENGSKYSAPYILSPGFDTTSQGTDYLYLFGNINGNEDWHSGRDALKAVRNGLGSYVFRLSTESECWFRIRTEWTEYGPENNTDRDIYMYDNELRTQADATAAFHLPAGSYTITAEWRGDNGYMLSIGELKTPVVYPDLYIMSDVQGWNASADRCLEHRGNGVYVYNFPDGITKGSSFKVSTADWNLSFSSNRGILPNHTYMCNENNRSGSNMTIPEDIPGPAEVVFDYNLNSFRINAPNYTGATDKSNRLYIHFGQNRRYGGNQDATPRVRLHDSTCFFSPSDEELRAAETFELKRVDPSDITYDLWYYELTPDQMSWAEDATFFFEKTDGSLEKYTCGRHVNGDDFNWDFQNWRKYIYYSDVADNYNAKAAQSYITWEELSPVRDNDKTDLYIVGEGLQRLAPVTPGTTGWDRIVDETIFSSPATMNVFYVEDLTAHELTKSYVLDSDEINEGAKFKMSWLYPWKRWMDSGKSGGEICQQRAWATFNLGIVGFSLMRATEKDIELKYGVTKTNREVYFKSSETFPCNNFNQYDWFVEKKFLGDVKFTLVVDLDKECYSATLLPFAPHPTATVQKVGVKTAQLDSHADADGFWDITPDPLKAESANGPVKYRKYNVATADVKIDAPNSVAIQESGHTVVYGLYWDKSLSTIYSGNPGEISLDGIPVSGSGVFGVRAKYTDVQSGFTFHSKFSEGEVKANVNVEAPVIGEPSDKTYVSGVKYGDRFTFGAYFDIPVQNPSPLNWYADYEVTPSEWSDGDGLSKGGELVHGGHRVFTENSGKSFHALDGWTIWSEGDFGDSHDWSHKLSADGNNWPIFLSEVKYFEYKNNYTDSELTTVLNMDVDAIYPFLVEVNPVPVEKSKSQAVAPSRAGSNVHRLELVRTSANTKSIILDRQVISGVEDVEADTSTYDVRYFNLQGIEVGGELTPGVYIRQQGMSATKVIVR